MTLVQTAAGEIRQSSAQLISLYKLRLVSATTRRMTSATKSNGWSSRGLAVGRAGRDLEARIALTVARYEGCKRERDAHGH